MRIPEISKNSREAAETTDEAWSQGYKRSIDCGNPRGFSQKAHCAARRKRQSGGNTKSKPVRENTDLLEAKRKRARTLIDGMIKTLIARGRTRDEAIADLKKQIDSRFYEQVMGDDAIISESQKLTRADPVERWIAVFKGSSNPKFAGKSSEQRERMARAAHYRAVQNHNPFASKKVVATEDDLDELRIDNKQGWGAVPFNQSVDYHGLRVAVRPSMFLRLAHELEHPHSADDIEQHLRSGGAVGAPFLMVAIPQDWFEGDTSHPAEIYGHEGRNRMNAALRTEGDEPVETHLFFGGGMRNRDLTPEIVDRLNQEVISQRGTHVNGPWFSMAVSEVAKVRISKDPNDLGAYVDDEGEPEPTVRLPLSKITSVLEPDEYHAEKPGAIDRVERMAKDIRSGRDMPAILVRRHGDGYQVLDGHHRFKAYRQVDADYIPARIVDPENITGDIDENFADGKGPGRAGDSQRHGIPKGATMAQLRKAAKAKGRKGQLARWQINMRNGRKKANEAIAPHGGPEDELRMMKAGTKPATLMLDYHFDTLYRPLVDEMGWEVVRFNIGSDVHYVVAQPGGRARAERIARMVSDANKVIRTGARLKPEYHRELGTLLGYSQADIDHFIGKVYGDTVPAEEGMVSEANINPNGAALTVFDMDETLFHTKARIYVVRDGDIIRRLSNQEYNTYHLKPGETFDYREFRDARFFHDTSVPIERMWRKAQNLLNNIGKRPGSRVIIVTARTDLDDRETFLDTFRKHGLDIDKVHVHRAGNLPVPAAAAKKAIIATYLNTGQFDTVRLIDDAESNLRSFLELRGDYPGIRFSAYLVLPGGNMAKYEL